VELSLDVQALTIQPKILPLDSEEPLGPLVKFFKFRNSESPVVLNLRNGKAARVR
jgi:hypothetical protein